MTARVVDKPWGHELLWAQTERYAAKILHIKKGQALTLQYHGKKDQTIMVLSGRMELVHYREGDKPQSTILSARQPFHLPPGLRHRMIAVDDCDVVEVGTAETDDLVRLEEAPAKR
jgi:mannose-6-phosphate isomerase-like protein (cupin superfamily)